ncbi:MAG: hypothetical protein BM556_09730 [Bacteriovorax sp. MedPE-SWde]|nr:MAG: hypothetical protein BM556_09730 [Bacteriovorax sp. MedPE-SWde]
MTLAKRFAILAALLISPMGIARNYIIYSVMHELPMGHQDEQTKKNYYINIGNKQGVSDGTILDVYRTVVRNDPYESKKRYTYEIKIGELEVVHKDDDAAIAISKTVLNDSKSPLFEIPNFMVGDKVKVHLK